MEKQKKEILTGGGEIEWKHISSNQTLSEEFIEKHIDKINTNCILNYKKFSLDFIKKYKDKFVPINVFRSQYITRKELKSIYNI